MESVECVHEWSELGEWPLEWPSGRPGVLVSVCDQYSCIVNVCVKCGKRTAGSSSAGIATAASAAPAWHEDVDDVKKSEVERLWDVVSELSARVKYLEKQHALMLSGMVAKK